MTYEEINQMVAEIAETCGCEYGYYAVDSETTTKVPYLLFLMATNTDTYADDENYCEKVALAIEYDTADRSIDDEKEIEAILRSHDLTYAKTTATVDGQHVHQVMYEMEVFINAE